MARTLAELQPAQTARIGHVAGGDGLSQRLCELGFTPGQAVAVVRLAPLGDPMQIRIRGFDVALRRREAERVVLEA